MAAVTTPVSAAYAYCQQLANSHYENFPVASRLLPSQLRLPVAAIYAFARTADDIADEGDPDPNIRYQQLNAYQAAFLDTRSQQHEAIPQPWRLIFLAVHHSMQNYQLPLNLFLDLLSAFRQDIEQKSYANIAELMDYCRRSANPVGRLLLALQHQQDAALLAKSDAICSGLQLLNFMQDIQQDLDENQRCYFPQDEMQQFGISQDDISQQRHSPALLKLFQLQVQRAQHMLLSGQDLGKQLGGRLGLEISLITAAGLRVAEQLLALQTNIFARPRLGKIDSIGILYHGIHAFLWAKPSTAVTSQITHS